MKILFITTAVSSRKLTELFNKSRKNPGFAVQKYNKLIIEGYISNGVEIEVLSRIPLQVGKTTFGVETYKAEVENGVKYHIMPYLKNPFLYHIFQMIYSFCFVLCWSLKNRGNYIFGDVLCKSLVIGSIPATKLTGTKSIGLVTDMPGMSSQVPNGYKQKKIGERLHYYFISKYNGFVLISPLSSKLINKQNRPFMVMEGLVDHKFHTTDIQKNETIDFLYAGGLNEVYGIKMLTEAFMKLKEPNVRLIYYGDGPFVNELKQYASKDSRIEYRGVAINKDIVTAELKASFLVNPRPTRDEYTLYSFPSKNIEYMLSGTPVITTKLAAMPKEYYDYVYTFDEESIDGYYKTLCECLSISRSDTTNKGKNAQKFVISTRNNIVQTKRIISFIKSLKS